MQAKIARQWCFDDNSYRLDDFGPDPYPESEREESTPLILLHFHQSTNQHSS